MHPCGIAHARTHWTKGAIERVCVYFFPSLSFLELVAGSSISSGRRVTPATIDLSADSCLKMSGAARLKFWHEGPELQNIL